MRKIISHTEVSAQEYLSAFGFEEEQVELLIKSGKRDLEKILSQLDGLLSSDVLSRQEIDNALHALKGLLFQLGNHTLADQIEHMRTIPGDAGYVTELTALLS